MNYKLICILELSHKGEDKPISEEFMKQYENKLKRILN